MSLWSRLRDARYALPALVERHVAGPSARDVAALGARQGGRASFGYFPANPSTPDTIEAANLEMLAAGAGLDAYLSIKAPHMAFAPDRHDRIAAAAKAAGMAILFDAHAPHQAEATLALAERLAAGAVLPARWQRSRGDAERMRDQSGRIRVVKGEWADPDGDAANKDAAYLALIGHLAGRAAPVAVATHDPLLAAAAMDMLLKAGTPCELEMLRGLPARRCAAEAAARAVPVRFYWPFGPGWWPYAVDKALARPYLPLWFLRDRLGL